MSYAIKTIYYTIQGEGCHQGRPAVFLRFSGCNLWSGREQGRVRAICQFCDTDFLGIDGPDGGHFSCASELARTVKSFWPADAPGKPFVVCTGGEPLLQMDRKVVDALHQEGFEVAVETNGTRSAPDGIDWLCVSPKAGSELEITKGNELKLVFPQPGAMPEDFASLEFDNFFLQPMDGPDAEKNTKLAMKYCLEHPQWRLSLQLHKVLGIP